MLSGETATATATCTFDNANVGNNKTVTCTSFVLDGGQKDNYSVTTSSTTGSANITAKALTPTVSASNKTYDGTTTATCDSSVTLTGIESGDTVTGSANTTGAFGDANKGNNKTVTCSGIPLSGASAGNYSVATSGTTTANITARETTCTSSSTEVTYSGSAVTSAGGSCTNLVTGHEATFTNSGSQNGVGTTSNTITSVVINSGATDVSNNYSITSVAGTIKVNGITRTATFNPNNNTLSQPTGCSKNTTTGVVTCSCTTTGTNTSCNITSPQITAHTNTTSICGYSGSSTGVKTGCTGHNESLGLSSNETYYAQTYSDKSGTFTVQDPDAAIKSGGSTNCTAYNGTANCTITAPQLTKKEGYEVVGWKLNGTTASNTSDLASTGSATTSITGNVVYKSVTYRIFTATTQKNVSSATGTGTSATCNQYNGVGSCNIVLPTNPYSLSNFTFNGWVNAGSATTTTTTSGTEAGQNMSISGNVNIVATWYRQLSVTFSRNTTEISNSLSSTSGSCTIYNEETSCTASANTPTFTANDGYVALGFFTSNSGTMTSSSTPKLATGTSYTISTGSTNLGNKTIQTGTTVYARGRYVIASEVGYSNTNTGLKNTNGGNCTEVQCALDALGRLLQ